MSEMTCPKCGAVQPAGDACRKCGLLRARFVAAATQAEAELAPPDAMAAALWQAVEQHDTDKAHDAFVNHCAQIQALPHAAARYRDARGRLGEERSGRMLTRIAKLAEVAMAQQATAPRRANRTRKLVMIVALSTMVLAGIILLLVMYSRQATRARALGDEQLVIPQLQTSH